MWRGLPRGFLVACVASIALPISSARAAPCNEQIEQFFIKNTVGYTHGTKNQILLKNRFLDQDCSGPVALSTAFIGKDDSRATWIEIGWWEEVCPAPGSHCWAVFVEKGVNGEITHIEKIVAPNLQPGTYDQWRVANRPKNPNGTTDWHLEVNFLIGQGWVDVRTYTTNWHTGIAYGETEAKGNDTGLREDQRNLQHKSAPGTWVNWSGQSCRKGTSPDFKYKERSNTFFEIVAETPGGC